MEAPATANLVSTVSALGTWSILASGNRPAGFYALLQSGHSRMNRASNFGFPSPILIKIGRVMKIPAAILFGALLVTTPLFARDKTDVLVMNNGDRVTCEIKGLGAGVLYVSIDYVDGTASVDWSKVRHVESTQLFIVKTTDGSVYTGTL